MDICNLNISLYPLTLIDPFKLDGLTVLSSSLYSFMIHSVLTPFGARPV